MKRDFVYKSVLLGLLLVAGTARSAQPQPVAAAPKAPLPAPEKSVFADAAGFGRDPFFPNSRRRQNQVVPKTMLTGDIPNGIVLKGLSGTAQKRLAVINNYTLAEGEETELRAAGGQYFRVRCVEIRDGSVMISVNGMEPKELKMRTGI